MFSTESEEDGYRLHVTNIGGTTPSGKVKVVPISFDITSLIQTNIFQLNNSDKNRIYARVNLI